MTNNENKNISTDRSSKFLKDIGVYAIGNIGSKLITFLMVPLYTYFVPNKSDFGYYDVCLSMCFLLIPFVTLQMRDGAFRFLLDCDDETRRQRIVTFVGRSMLTTLSLSAVAAFVMSLTTNIGYLGYSFALLVAMSLQEVYSQVFRGLGNNRSFVMVGIISAFCIGLFSLIFVAGFGWGIKGIFLANIVARLLALLVVEARVRLITRYTKWSLSSREVGLDLLRFTLPLLPGSLCWWITGSSDRMFIKYFIGLDANGVYAVAIRYTGVIMTLAVIFYQAWQETAILQYHSADRNRFFSKMFNGYIFLLSAILIGYVFLLKVFYPLLAHGGYRASLNYIYPLGVSAVIFAIAAFFDMGYQCAKDTPRTLPAIVLVAFINVILNFILIKPLGVYGVIATQLVTYAVLVIYRWYDMKRYFILKINKRVLVPITMVILSAIPFYFSPGAWADIAFAAAALALIVWSCGKDTRDLIISKFTKTHGSTK
ncbi:MAG: oligosaccharide flippase family protein [Muribaculaceae bacterium]|nr:oligosaccharide flippase family protein [Muribaculaceae bacterium]